MPDSQTVQVDEKVQQVGPQNQQSINQKILEKPSDVQMEHANIQNNGLK